MTQNIYCGAWNFRAPVHGIRTFSLNEQTGCWEDKGVFGNQPGQSILALAGPWLVSVCEMGNCARMVCYARPADGTLEERDVLEIQSTKLSYVVSAPDGRHVYASSMGDGTVRMIRVSPEGQLTLTDEWKLTGHGVTPRQNQAKVHSVMISPDGTLLAAANLGADEVELFRVDQEKEILRLADSKPVDLCREPRHMAFSPDGKWLYVLTEGGNRLYVFSVREARLREYAAYNVLDPKGEQKGAAADIVVSRDGNLIYTTNRGQHSIAVWRKLSSGLLDSAGFYACGGEGPRGLFLSPDGKTLFSANNDSGTVTVLPLDRNGLPGPAMQSLDVPGAGCVRGI